VSSLRLQRCVLHPGREAAARCPGCGRHFCRECVTEHEGRFLCAACIHRLTDEKGAPGRSAALRRVGKAVGRAVAMVGCFVLAWLFYLLVATLLSAVPHKFHDSSALEELVSGSESR